MLSLSARYLESSNGNIPSSLTLALYQHTIQLLVPQLYMRDIAVIASCVILCVLEMFSCSPKAWRRHLDGCASLMQSLNLRGDSGGKEEAVFWCFARMDLCGGLISLERTLIPVDKWTSENVSEVSVETYPRSGCFHDYAKMATNIIAQAMDLFASYHASEGAFGLSAANPLERGAYERRWRRLFDVVQEWFATRPMEILPVMAVSAKECGLPFPTVLYSNGRRDLGQPVRSHRGHIDAPTEASRSYTRESPLDTLACSTNLRHRSVKRLSWGLDQHPAADLDCRSTDEPSSRTCCHCASSQNN
jgi:hypothetical protein